MRLSSVSSSVAWKHMKKEPEHLKVSETGLVQSHIEIYYIYDNACITVVPDNMVKLQKQNVVKNKPY